MNLAAIAQIINEFYILIQTLLAATAIFMFGHGVKKFMWSAEVGAMSGMSPQNMRSEGTASIIWAVIIANFSAVISAVTGDLYGAREFEWVELKDTGNTSRFIGDFIVSAFTLLGFFVIYKTRLTIQKINTGESTLGTLLFQVGVAIACTQIQEIINLIGSLTVFNPLGAFFDKPVISIK